MGNKKLAIFFTHIFLSHLICKDLQNYYEEGWVGGRAEGVLKYWEDFLVLKLTIWERFTGFGKIFTPVSNKWHQICPLFSGRCCWTYCALSKGCTW